MEAASAYGGVLLWGLRIRFERITRSIGGVLALYQIVELQQHGCVCWILAWLSTMGT